MALPLGDRLERGARGGGEAVQDHESDVMAGFLVLPSGIAEADDELERHGLDE